jgi:hypothetical protein
MVNLRFVVLSLVLVSVLVCGNALVNAEQNDKKSGESLSIPIGKIELVPPEGVEPKRSTVEFPHSKHFTYNCRECHHKWDLSAELPGCMTSGCHNLVKAPKKSERIDAVLYYKKAYHEKCIGCHREIKKQNLAMEKKVSIDAKNLKIQKVGPTGCVICHPKNIISVNK